MKAVKFILSLMIGFFSSYGQTFHCGYKRLDSIMAISDPNYNNRRLTYETMLTDSMAKFHLDTLVARFSEIEMVDVKIPVVIHNIGPSNILPYTAQNFINALNAIFSNANNAPEGADTQIQFCMAHVDPNGNSTTGITNNAGPNTSICVGNEASVKNIVSWDPIHYLNIWVCDLTNCGIQAWGTPPGTYDASHMSYDGVVCDMALLNNSSTNPVPIAEEIGHWLSLYHTYGDGITPCGQLGPNQTPGNSDLVGDTPWCYGSSGATYPNCNAPTQPQCASANGFTPKARQISNYMDDSDDGCKTTFTTGQKTRMQLCINGSRFYINDKNPSVALSLCGQPSCNNGIQDEGETGVDCGGPCPPCAEINCAETVDFYVNSQSPESGKFINVCNIGDIKLNPHPYGHNCTYPAWLTTEVSGWSTHQPPYSYNCTFSTFRQQWKCYRSVIFISVQECDENKNLIGTEFYDWLDLGAIKPTSSDIDLYSVLSLLGISINESKMYKVKVANTKSLPSGTLWKEQSAFIKVFKSTLSLSNKTINIDEYADYLNYSNCIVNASKSVAQVQIDVTGESDLKNGDYSIATYNCSQLPSFRIPATVPPQSTNTITSNSGTSTMSRSITDYNSKNSSKEVTLKIAPNPTDGIVKISLLNATEPFTSIQILSLSGVAFYEETKITMQELELDLKNLKAGLYFIKVNYQGVIYNTKLVKQ